MYVAVIKAELHLPYAASWQTLPSDSALPPAQVLRTARPMWIETEDDYARDAPAAIERVRASNRVFPLAVLPLVREGQAIGVVIFTYEHPHKITAEERTFLSALTRASEQALERARLHVAEANARAAAELANKRKDEFLAMLGHELRNPLAAIRSAAELVRVRGAGLEREAEILQRQLAQLTHILDDLLDVSRITRNKIELRCERIDLRAAISSALETVAPLSNAAGHVLTVDLPPTPLWVYADLTRLSQAFANILNNAAKFTDRGGRITVAASVEGRETVVTLSDNGIGIDTSALPTIFDMFVQIDQGSSRARSGLGIGLALAKRLVELHDGHIEARSAGLGTGTTFTVSLPVAAAADPPKPLASVPHATERCRVLVADDIPDAAEMMRMMIECMGHDVRVAVDGVQAVEIAEQFEPQIALLDIGMPRMDGYEAARHIRANLGDRVFLVAVTGWGQEEDQRRAYAAGFDRHVTKPAEPAVLESLIASVAEQKPAQLSTDTHGSN